MKFGTITRGGNSMFLGSQMPRPKGRELSVPENFCDFLHMYTQYEKQRPNFA